MSIDAATSTDGEGLRRPTHRSRTGSRHAGGTLDPCATDLDRCIELDVAMDLQFQHHDAAGYVEVEVFENSTPVDFGCDPDASTGLAVCTARVSLVSQGYRAMCGWIQLVRSTDNSSGGQGFDMDPFAPSGTDSAYAFYGAHPVRRAGKGRPQRSRLASARLPRAHSAGNHHGRGATGLLLGLPPPRRGGRHLGPGPS